MKILFVCLGNICRSPAGEIIFSKLVNQAGLKNRFMLDSAGTEASWPGAKPDKRMLEALQKRGYSDNGHKARRISAQDLEDFDLIVTMDDSNYYEVLRLDPQKKNTHKVVKMAHYVKSSHVSEIPDPWYGGKDGFYKVIELLESGCATLLKKLKK